MRFEDMLNNAQNVLAKREEVMKLLEPYDLSAEDVPQEALKIAEMMPSTSSVLDAERTINLYDTVYTKLTADELERLKAHPVYALNDVRTFADIKDKYGLTWNELKGMVLAVK